MSLSVAIILDKRYKKKEDKYPIKLRVIFRRETKAYPTIYDFTEKEYKKFSAPRISAELKEIRESLINLETEAKNYTKEIKHFSFEVFKENFVNPNPLLKTRKEKKWLKPISDDAKAEKKKGEIDLKEYEDDFPILNENSPAEDYISATYKSYITRLLEEERIGTAECYQGSYYSIKSFAGDLPFCRITRSFLVRYEKWMTVEKGCSLASVGIALRPLRAMFNAAINKKKIISRDIYPFGPEEYSIPTNPGSVRALKKRDVKELYEYCPKEFNQRQAQAYWFFCYFGNGMNPSDLAHLRYRNIQEDYIKFIRRKTRWTTRSNPKTISVYLNDKVQKIIKEWGNEDKAPGNYIFPVLQQGMTALDRHKEVRKLCRFISDGMKEIVAQIQLNKMVNNKVCRKSLATNLKLIGAPTSFIQDVLGHMNITTTEIYLEDYDDEIKKNFSMNIASL